jgi:polysaccharide biosynthesis/export protein
MRKRFADLGLCVALGLGLCACLTAQGAAQGGAQGAAQGGAQGAAQGPVMPAGGAEAGAATSTAPASVAATPTEVTTIPPATAAKGPSEPAMTAPERKPDYVLGPEDQIVIRAFQAEEISDKPLQVGGDGYISVPMIGRVKAGGLTVAQLEAELTKKLATYYEHPQVTVLVTDYRSQPVSIIGAVTSPGVIQLRGPKNLLQVISQAGGLRADSGNTVTITREHKPGVDPLPIGTTDPTGRYSVAQVNLRDVMDAKTPQNNVKIESGDVITVARAQMVYVIGEVQRPGGYVLNDRNSLSLLQALSLAGGMKPTASAKKTKVLREEEGKPQRVEVANDVRKILAGNAPDMQLHPDDILFVPNSTAKSAGIRAAETALSVGTGLAIWR